MLDRCGALLAGPDAHGLLHVEHEDLAVAHLAGVARAGGRDEHVDDAVHDLAPHHSFDLQARPERNVDGGAPVLFRIAALRAAALHLGHGEP